ncbi:E-selectin-like isoform X2 [Dreissena polymorpha]|uniref:E-selectin-like isoform X2 n=1 Tax=Dreissena polymorpha TaxID=45954 RepID=UPI002264A5FF|nr:E-selectin-like isoform X2 [Dreissena polymorpha]
MIAKIGTTICLTVAVLMSILKASEYSDPFSCYADICNVKAEAQFCDVVARKCRQCSDVRDDCFTRLQTLNCTQFCYDVRFNSDREKIRVAGCDVPSTPRNGHYQVNTARRVAYNTTLDVNCDIGYALVQTEALKCSNYSMWSGSKPKCEVVGCPIPNPPEHGRYTVNLSHIPINGTLEFICDLDYTPGNNMPLQCGHNSQWSAQQPVCISKDPLDNGNTERKILDQSNEHTDSINDVSESLIPVHASSSRFESDYPYQSKEDTHARSDSPIVTQPELGDTGEDVKIAHNHGEFHPLDIELNRRLF